MLPVVTNIGLEIPFLLTGAIVTETIFSWPGVGRLTITATNNFDYPTLMGLLLIAAVATVSRTSSRTSRTPSSTRASSTESSSHGDHQADPGRGERIPVAVPTQDLRLAESEGGVDYDVTLESLGQWQLAWSKFRRSQDGHLRASSC